MSILGIDEVGRGPWAGPLVVGAVILPARFDEKGTKIKSQSWQDELADSKKLTAKKREKLAPIIQEKSIASGLGWVDSKELDKLGLSDALKLATQRAVSAVLGQGSNTGILKNKKLDSMSYDTQQGINLNSLFSEIIIDGTNNFLSDTIFGEYVTVLPKADAKIKEVSAASIIAKVARDSYMRNIAKQYPEYGFEKHVGYGTAVHKAALEKYGPCPEHRSSFAPIARLLSSTKNVVQSTSEGQAEHVQAKQSPTTKLGSRAEQTVSDYLESKGHKLLARNYKTKFYEIDIVSADQKHIYFTEVKYRQNSDHGSPLECIDSKKQKQITFAAECFMKLLSRRLNRPLSDLPSPILAAAAVEGADFHLVKWLPIVV